MSESCRDEELTGHETAFGAGECGRHDEPMDEEENILAGRPDVNMPALLTRDVPGG